MKKSKDPETRLGFEALLAAKEGGLAAVNVVTTTEFSKAGRYRFETLLKTHRTSLATDPRDKVFSLLGIANQDKPPFTEPAKAKLLAANYEIPVERLYNRVARLLIESQGDLRLLKQRESNREISLKSLPSWIPDFSIWLIPSAFPDTWSANGEWAWKADLRDYDDALLGVQGQLLGTIEACSKPPFIILESPLWGSIAEVASGLPEYYTPFCCSHIQKPETRVEALARTCIADTLSSRMPAPADLLCNQFMLHIATMVLWGFQWYSEKDRSLASRITGKMHRMMITKFDRSINELRITPWLRLLKKEPEGSAYTGYALVAAMENLLETEWNTSTFADYKRQTQIITGYRTIFRTNTKLLGTGPVDAQKGDEVWILAGMSEPVVLRRSKVKVQDGLMREFLGAAYVHGIMNGEVMSANLLKQDIMLQ